VSRNRSAWFSLGYLLVIAVIVLVIVLFVLWLA
jgi:CHASE3 domain sensor protein